MEVRPVKYYTPGKSVQISWGKGNKNRFAEKLILMSYATKRQFSCKISFPVTKCPTRGSGHVFFCLSQQQQQKLNQKQAATQLT